MIPRHSLPFSAGKFIRMMFSGPDINISDFEKACADSLGVREVVALPSVRGGIHMTVLAGMLPRGNVVGPVYTCDTVHLALALSGVHSHLVDTSPDSFLMSPEAIRKVAGPECVLLLSEVYGIPYGLKFFEEKSGMQSNLRILDLAMCIASPERMKQLEPKDVALFSFGWGKPMYAGWGGIACFRDPELAGRVRDIRDRWTVGESLALSFRRVCRSLFRVTVNQRGVYGLWHQRQLYHLYGALTHRCNRNAEKGCAFSSAAVSEQGSRPEWTRPMTPLNRKLALHNMRNAMRDIKLRLNQAEIYYRLLVETGIVRGPNIDGLPQSHFPIRVTPEVRDRMCDFLRGKGIDTGKLFPFPRGLDRSSYPNAAKAADEVVTLPLGPYITFNEVKIIAECVKDGLRALGC